MTVPGNLSSPLLAVAAAAAGGGAGGVATKSLRFNSGDSAHLNRTPSSSSNRKKFTWAGWVKRSKSGHSDFFSAVQDFNNATIIQFDNSDRLDFEDYQTSNVGRRITTAVFRDYSAWYHICCVYDSDNSTADDRIKLFVNGTQITTFDSTTNPSSGHTTLINSANAHYVGVDKGFSNHYFNGYLADVYLIDGLAIEPVNNFIELDSNGVYQAKAYSGTFGTNGFHLSFSDATSTTTIAEDSSGNNNDFTANNISVTAGAGNDSLFDVPTNGDQSDTGAGGEVSGNYCTWNNAAHVSNGSSNSTFANGTLEGTTSNSNVSGALGTIGVSSGKWYYEITCGAFTGGTGLEIGASQEDLQSTISASQGPGDCPNGYFYINDGRKVNNSSPSSYGATYTDGDVIGVALDLDNNTIEFFKNGTSQGDAYTSMNAGTYFPAVGDYNNSGTASFTANFGQRAFAYQNPGTNRPAATFKALCTTNLPTPTIADGSEYFDIALYTGTGNSGQTVSNLNHSPDLVWFKSRSEARNHAVFDTVRGVEKRLQVNIIQAEDDSGSGLTAFNSDGFTFGSNNVNGRSGTTYAAFTWDAGSSTVSNTDGSLTSNVRANTSAGFSIVKYTAGSGSSNETVGHSLNAVPEFILLKRMDGSDPFVAFHKALSTGQYLEANSNSAAQSSASVFETAHTSSVFGIGTDGRVNAGGNSYIAYVWTSIAGFSQFTTFEGTGSSDPVFVHCGFRPKWILRKNIDADKNWYLHDTARDTFNICTKEFQLHSSIAEGDHDAMDILSNGFAIRTSNAQHNNSGSTHLVAAFAENPFQANGGLAR